MEAMMKIQAQNCKNIAAFERKGDQLGFCPKGNISKKNKTNKQTKQTKKQTNTPFGWCF